MGHNLRRVSGVYFAQLHFPGRIDCRIDKDDGVCLSHGRGKLGRQQRAAQRANPGQSEVFNGIRRARANTIVASQSIAVSNYEQIEAAAKPVDVSPR